MNKKIQQLQADLDETFDGYVKIGYHDTSTGQEFDPYQTYYLYIDDDTVTVRPIISMSCVMSMKLTLQLQQYVDMLMK